ncbi:hypothetical protein [cf. Phormidesmis sp. LEGE 11477]|uniref:hypothetical protein n=1 Tax=cf. Phormidesmis sp. LEGE 11477 TaxID=1828680 RepID=UPI001880FFFA|nr:hypothetical protein [cf. Phormidesmis sp. LEGE 11477]MBE9060547.1 hypothetical protein [cf. Phormidesmis sp. LEGE 11477]
MTRKLQYSQSSVEAARYYVRLKTHNSNSLFELEKSSTQAPLPHSLAKIVADELRQVETNYKGITLDQWILEPDSLHALVSLKSTHTKQTDQSRKPAMLSAFVAGLKAATAKRINLIRNEPGSPVWQRSYKEQRIEDDRMLFRLRKKLDDSTRALCSS